MKTKKVLAAFLAATLVMSSMVGCGDTTYSAACDFFYSNDKGHTYGNGTKEYVIGDTVYMKVQFKVTSNDDEVSQVKVVLTIPKIDNVDAKYMDGQIITPNYDSVNNVTTYEFTANASETATDQNCVIQFVPNTAGEIQMKLEFDDNVDPSYDKQSTLVFVEPEPEETTTAETTTTTTETTTTTTETTTTTTTTETTTTTTTTATTASETAAESSSSSTTETTAVPEDNTEEE